MLTLKKDLPSLADERPPDSLRAVARARTLTVLSRLDGARKGNVVQFLYEASLINKGQSIVSLAVPIFSIPTLALPTLALPALPKTN